MESGKQGISETSSSEENDRLELVKKEKGTKRCYECIFCKRGFTNAQALGGHMNIHRKDRAKTKQNILVSSPVDHQIEETMAYRFVAPVSTQPTRYYPVVLEPQRDYYTCYLQPYSSGSGTAYRTQSKTTNPEILGRNLSLSFNSAHLEDSEVRRCNLGNSEEVDLELRLGHG